MARLKPTTTVHTLAKAGNLIRSVRSDEITLFLKRIKRMTTVFKRFEFTLLLRGQNGCPVAAFIVAPPHSLIGSIYFNVVN